MFFAEVMDSDVSAIYNNSDQAVMRTSFLFRSHVLTIGLDPETDLIRLVFSDFKDTQTSNSVCILERKTLPKDLRSAWKLIKSLSKLLHEAISLLHGARSAIGETSHQKLSLPFEKEIKSFLMFYRISTMDPSTADLIEFQHALENMSTIVPRIRMMISMLRRGFIQAAKTSCHGHIDSASGSYVGACISQEEVECTKFQIHPSGPTPVYYPEIYLCSNENYTNCFAENEKSGLRDLISTDCCNYLIQANSSFLPDAHLYCPSYSLDNFSPLISMHGILIPAIKDEVRLKCEDQQSAILENTVLTNCDVSFQEEKLVSNGEEKIMSPILKWEENLTFGDEFESFLERHWAAIAATGVIILVACIRLCMCCLPCFKAVCCCCRRVRYHVSANDSLEL